MKILMLETRRGTEDGIIVQRFFMEKEYDVREGLARSFLAAGFAIPASHRKKLYRRKK